MSVQFGRCSLDGSPVDRGDFAQIHKLLRPYGPDRAGSFILPNAAILYRAFHTNNEAEEEVQPHVSRSEMVMTWDGRLDNRDELVRSLQGNVSSSSSDLAIVAAAYERWNTDSFARITGDWALTVWNEKERLLTLAKDFIGTRHLYYAVDKYQVSWSTILDALVLPARHSFPLEEEYVAGWLSFFPATSLTPFAGICAVPAAHFVIIQAGRIVTRKYWEFNGTKTIRYRRGEEYEDHFRSVFEQSIRRRLRSNRPVLAELSGGIDSSAIVSIADELIARGSMVKTRLDTVSFYDDSQPNWNERPFFSKIEEKRGAVGCHIDARPLSPESVPGVCKFPATPAHIRLFDSASAGFAKCLMQNGNRVVLSGIGGDEVTGGVPTPLPELADLIAAGDLRCLARQLKAWSLEKRRPWLHLLAETVAKFLPRTSGSAQAALPAAPWLKPAFLARNHAAFAGYESRWRLFREAPSFQENLASIEALRRQLACEVLHSDPCREKRYPYLDRDLLEFLLAIPREQLLRPGNRRSLLRRALASTVPAEILNRRSKAYVARLPRQILTFSIDLIRDQECFCDLLGIIDSALLRQALESAWASNPFPAVALMRTLAAEIWLRSTQKRLQLPILRPRKKWSPAGCRQGI